ncbi:MAG: DNA-binding protein, partial [Cyanobacteria bacterium J06641_5]
LAKVYSSQERMRLELTGLERDFARRRELLAGSIGTSDVVKLLHLTPQAIRKRVSQQKLLAVLDGGDYRFPLEQFDAQGPNGVVDGLSEVLQAMSSISDYARLNWLATPNPIFANATPFEALRKGEKDSAIATAHSIHLL